MAIGMHPTAPSRDAVVTEEKQGPVCTKTASNLCKFLSVIGCVVVVSRSFIFLSFFFDFQCGFCHLACF